MFRLKFQQDTGCSSSLQIFRINFNLLSVLVPEIVGIFMRLIHSDWILLYCLLVVLTVTSERWCSEAGGDSFYLIFMDWEWEKNSFPKIQWYCFFLEKVNGCCVAKWMNETMLRLHQDQLFTYWISPSRLLFYTSLCDANCPAQAPLSAGFLLSSANGRHCRKTAEEKRQRRNFFWFSSFLHLPSNNSRRLAPAPASLGPSSTFL